jgi:hypothetical protein
MVAECRLPGRLKTPGKRRGNIEEMRKHPDWSRPLPRPLEIPSTMTLKMLDDVRELLKHLPKGHRGRSSWRHVAACLTEAAAGGNTIDVAVPLKMVLCMEGVPYQAK